MTDGIRVATPDDAGAIRDIYAPYVTGTAITFATDPPDEGELADDIGGANRYPWLVCEEEGAVVGYATASSLRSRPAYDWAVELTIYVAEDAQRSGVGRGLYTALMDVLALQGYCDAYAVTTLPNPASVGLHESMEFDRVGRFPAAGYKLGDWHDVAWWHRRLRERPADPDPPAPMEVVRETSAFADALRAGEAELAE